MKDFIKAAAHSKNADLVLKNGNIVDVFNGEIIKADLAIYKDKIIGIGKYSGNEEIDCSDKFISPAFIDSHVHIESSRVTPRVFSQILLKKGVLTAVCDPHEIANVLGTEGLEFMLSDSREAAVDLYFMLPSCVPATPDEDNGAKLLAKDLGIFMERDRVLGLGEVMDVPSVINSNPDMMDKLEMFRNKIIDGHSPCINPEILDAYVISGIKTDHECETPTEAVEKVRRGLYVMLRQGSAARNLEKILPAVNNNNYKRFLFCTDDKDITDLESEGSVDYNVKLSVKLGLDPIKALTIASLNSAECYGLKNRGALAPGYKADILVLDDLKDFNINKIVRNGKIVKAEPYTTLISSFKSSMNMGKVKKEAFDIKSEKDTVNVIKITKNSLITERVKRKANIENGLVKSVQGDDILKIAVFERHKNTGKYFVGFIEGFHLKDITIAQTIAHDSHNLILIGSSFLEEAANRLIDIGGGIVLLYKGKIVEELSLPIAGIMTDENPDIVINKINKMNKFINEGKENDSNVLLTLGFMALTVIPYFKITDKGLYDFNKGTFVDLFD
ncbi:MAG: adenine deaminase [Bacillota bacterium]|nr:adenine deaminase [Bacillota bacterium]